MQGQQFELDVNAFLGVTDWFSASDQPPVHAGWYDVRFKMSEEEREAREPQEGRRWWYPEAKCFSWLIPEGVTHSPEDMEARRLKHSVIGLASFEYRGSREPTLSEHWNLKARSEAPEEVPAPVLLRRR